MKRQRRESGQGSKKCVMRRALDGCHGEQRSGVVTVVGAAAAFKPMASHSPATTHPTTTFLVHLRALAQDVLNSSKAITELIDYASKKFLTSLTQSAWEEECELIVTILYLTIAVSKQRNSLFVKGVLVEFFGRWIEDAGGLEFPDILKIVKCEWKCTAFSTLLLLHANLFPDECDIATLEESLTWKSGWFKKKTPLWLLNSTACTDILKVNSLLMKSAMVLGGKVIDLESEDTYIGSTEKFLYANQLYKKGEFKASIECLHSISSQNCGADLQGWILWLTGLGLIKLGKSHTALLKLQAAVDKCQKCIPAIFNIAQIFSDMGLCTAELETLSLLKCSLEERDAFAPMNLQSSILELHHTPPSDLSLRTLCILASRCLQLKMYSEAIEKFTALLEKLEKHHEVMVTCSKTLLKSEDSVPELPAFECILVLAAVAHISNNESENALKVLSKFRETADLGGPMFYKSPHEVKITSITAAAAYLVRAEALEKIGDVTDALKECISLEQAISWVSGITSTEWDTTILLLKTRLYLSLSTLHLSKQNQQSHRLYKRLTAQCSYLLSVDNSPSWSYLSLSKKLAMNIIYSYMKERVDCNSL